MKINRDEEALLTMLNGYTDWLSGRWPVDIKRSFLDLRPQSCSSECEKNLESLQALHVKMDQDGTFAWVHASVSRLQNLHQGTNNIVNEELLLEFMKLGTVYSEMLMFDAANLVFGFAAPRLKPFNCRPHAFERACTSETMRNPDGSKRSRAVSLDARGRC
jgi:hypothetical protein